MAHEPVISERLVIGDDENDVGLVRGCSGDRANQKPLEDEDDKGFHGMCDGRVRNEVHGGEEESRNDFGDVLIKFNINLLNLFDFSEFNLIERP
jgi:hypothetical protein